MPADANLLDDTHGVKLPHWRHRPRIMPVLLLKGGLLYKTIKFSKPSYVGDPRIAVKIFSDKGADELVLLDIDATPMRREPNYALIEEIVSEAFMPVAYGGGITSLEQMKRIFRIGVEKVVLNTAAIKDPSLITRAAESFGVQSVVGSLDAKKEVFGGYRVYTSCGRKRTPLRPRDAAKLLADAGAGEIIINSIDRDGSFRGYDLRLVREVVDAVNVPVIACGGACRLEDFAEVIQMGAASAAAAGSFFVFQLPHRAVLITFPNEEKLSRLFGLPGDSPLACGRAAPSHEVGR